jgi:hypothetical protein
VNGAPRRVLVPAIGMGARDVSSSATCPADRSRSKSIARAIFLHVIEQHAAWIEANTHTGNIENTHAG